MGALQDWIGGTPAEAITLICAIVGALAALGLFRKSRLLGHEKENLEEQVKSSKDQLNNYRANARARDPDAFLDELKTKKLYGTRESQESHAGLYISNHKSAMSAAAMILAEKAYLLNANDTEINLAKAEAWIDLGLSINPDDENLHQFLREIKEIELTEDMPLFDANADAATLARIGKVFQDKIHFKQAQLYLEAACSKSAVTDGKRSATYAAHLNNLALLYHDMGDYPSAEPLYKQAIAIDKATIGEDHPEYAAHLNNLAMLYSAMGDYPSAEPLYKQAIAISQNALPPDHPDIKTFKTNLAAMQAARDKG